MGKITYRQCISCSAVKSIYQGFAKIGNSPARYSDDCKVCRKKAAEATPHDPVIWPWKYNGKVYSDENSSIL